jgi:CHAD domain-containing protein
MRPERLVIEANPRLIEDMAFCFKRRETLSKAAKRLIQERIGKARASLKSPDQSEAIHGLRTNVKKTRAVLRLFQCGLPKKFSRRQIKFLRDAAQCLAHTRDAHVSSEILKSLLRRSRRASKAPDFRPLLSTLASAAREESFRTEKKRTLRSVDSRLRKVAKQTDCLKLDGNEIEILGSGLKAAYRGARRGLEIARKEPTADNLHDWRKRTKDLWYDLRLLSPASPKALTPRISELKLLADALGEHQDLTMLRTNASRQLEAVEHVALFKNLDELVGKRQVELQATAFELGERLFAEKPAAFRKRLEGAWNAWHQAK